MPRLVTWIVTLLVVVFAAWLWVGRDERPDSSETRRRLMR
jgi:hypothetical protein